MCLAMKISSPDGSTLVEPVGLLNNRKWVGYVPSAPDQTVMGDQLSSGERRF